ncbi:hypothetical protein TA3x_003237 [Tundrisphaera sp. TA3]|uniref:hypothetical protein n=1 Tax=Tundrisphaera sp. TA3 TaxID=3435775 RepID=UPI003EBF6EB8
MAKSSHRRETRMLRPRFPWSSLEDRRLLSGLGLQLTIPAVVIPVELVQVTTVLDESPTVEVRAPIVGSLAEPIPILQDLVVEDVSGEDEEQAGPDPTITLPGPIVTPMPVVVIGPTPSSPTPADPPASGPTVPVVIPIIPDVTIVIPVEPPPPITTEPAVTPVVTPPDLPSPVPMGPEEEADPGSSGTTPIPEPTTVINPPPEVPIVDGPSTVEVPLVTPPPATPPAGTPTDESHSPGTPTPEVGPPASTEGDRPTAPPASAIDPPIGSGSGADPSRPDRPATPPIESPSKSPTAVVPPPSAPASPPPGNPETARPVASPDEVGEKPSKPASTASDSLKGTSAPAPTIFAGGSAERSGSLMSTPVAWTSSGPAGYFIPGNPSGGPPADELQFETTWEPLGLSPILSAASSAATLAAPSALLAEIASSDTYEATRDGIELALAVVSDLAESLPRISSEVLALELDSATSMVRAALDASQLDPVDVSGLVREMGELIASVRSHSVGRLVRMAALSPVTWIMLGVLVVVSTELARRELRNSASEPPAGGSPDLLATWGIS